MTVCVAMVTKGLEDIEELFDVREMESCSWFV